MNIKHSVSTPLPHLTSPHLLSGMNSHYRSRVGYLIHRMRTNQHHSSPSITTILSSNSSDQTTPSTSSIRSHQQQQQHHLDPSDRCIAAHIRRGSY